MKNSRQSTTDYTGRTVDLLLLQAVFEPVPDKEVRPDLSKDPRTVSGIEKLVQRYTYLFLTQLGSVKNRESEGSDFMSRLGSGQIYDMNTLRSEASAANSIVRRQIKNEDAILVTSDDEALDTSEIVELKIDRASATVSVTVKLTTVSGDEYIYVTPISTGI